MATRLNLIILIALCAIFYPIFFFDYAYMDEIHQLWHKGDGSNFTGFNTQGRFFTGLIFNSAFKRIDSISELKYLRIISFTGWIVVAMLYQFCLDKWLKILRFDNNFLWLNALFFISSLSIAIYIGWASCMEVFIAVGFGLMGGHFAFLYFIKEKPESRREEKWKIFVSVLLGVISLFTYQSSFGASLLPFFLFLLANKYTKKYEVLIPAVIIYLLCYLIYYLIFRFSLSEMGVVTSNRTEIQFNPLKKISFFIARGFSQALSFNFPFNYKGIFSQAFYPLMAATWLFCVFNFNRSTKVASKLIYILKIFLLLMLIYLPSLIAKENFASYRTMQSLNLAGSFLLFDSFFILVQTIKSRKTLVAILSCIFLIAGFYNFHFNFIYPLKDEYAAIRQDFDSRFNRDYQSLTVLRPPEKLFKKTHGVKNYLDEFGLPSTEKDWTPEPMYRQLILEKFHDIAFASSFGISHYPSSDSSLFQQRIVDSSCLSFDIQKTVCKYMISKKSEN